MLNDTPHIQVIGLSGTEYNLPEETYRRIEDGDDEIDELPNFEDIIPAIIKEWRQLK